jgi:hypothetical protein
MTLSCESWHGFLHDRGKIVFQILVAAGLLAGLMPALARTFADMRYECTVDCSTVLDTKQDTIGQKPASMLQGPIAR